MPFFRGTRYPLLGNVAGVNYLLRDEFTDTRAAGAVNGTIATPGPGTRVVVDTDGDALSVGSGGLQWANTNNNFSDPRLEYAAISSRTAGRVFLVEFTGGSGNWQFGFANLNDVIRINGFSVAIYPGNLVIASVSLATSYDFAYIHRANGYFVLVKGGAFTSWTLLYMFAAGTNTGLWINSYSQTCSNDYIRAPDITWTPRPLVSDSFDRANAAIGTSDGAGCEETAIATPAWTANVGAWTIATNVAVGSTLAGGLAIATLDTGDVNHITTGTIARTGNELGIVLRYVDADNYIRAIHDGTNCKLIKRVATAETDVISAAVAIGAGEIRVIPDGTSFSLYLNNVQVGATSTISDGALQTGTLAGLFSTNVANTFDNWYTFSRTGYSDLDAW